MSILVTDVNEKSLNALRTRCTGYVTASIIVLLFGLIYEQFSHEVYSAFMLGAFLIPLAGGALPCCVLRLLTKRRAPAKFLFELYGFGIATFTTGSILRGILEIYGTTNRLIGVYWAAGTALVAAPLILYALATIAAARSDRK